VWRVVIKPGVKRNAGLGLRLALAASASAPAGTRPCFATLPSRPTCIDQWLRRVRFLVARRIVVDSELIGLRDTCGSTTVGCGCQRVPRVRLTPAALGCGSGGRCTARPTCQMPQKEWLFIGGRIRIPKRSVEPAVASRHQSSIARRAAHRCQHPRHGR
jgi:hypothetical protein